MKLSGFLAVVLLVATAQAVVTPVTQTAGRVTPFLNPGSVSQSGSGRPFSSLNDARVIDGSSATSAFTLGGASSTALLEYTDWDVFTLLPEGHVSVDELDIGIVRGASIDSILSDSPSSPRYEFESSGAPVSVPISTGSTGWDTSSSIAWYNRTFGPSEVSRDDFDDASNLMPFTITFSGARTGINAIDGLVDGIQICVHTTIETQVTSFVDPSGRSSVHSYGDPAGGFTRTLQGTGMYFIHSIRLGSTVVTPTSADFNTATFTFPAGAGEYDVEISIDGGASYYNSNLLFSWGYTTTIEMAGYATTTFSDGFDADWVNTANAHGAPDGAVAETGGGAFGSSDYLVGHDFGFVLTPGAFVTDIQSTVTCANALGSGSGQARLYVGGSEVASASFPSLITDTLADYVVGGVGDRWGTDESELDRDDFESTSFGIGVQISSFASTIDAIEATITLIQSYAGQTLTPTSIVDNPTGGPSVTVFGEGFADPATSTASYACRFCDALNPSDCTAPAAATWVSVTEVNCGAAPDVLAQGWLDASVAGAEVIVEVSIDADATTPVFGAVTNDVIAYTFTPPTPGTPDVVPLASLPATLPTVFVEATNVFDTPLLSCAIDRQDASPLIWVAGTVASGGVNCPLPSLPTNPTPIVVSISNDFNNAVTRGASDWVHYSFQVETTEAVPDNVPSTGGPYTIDIDGAFANSGDIFCQFGSNPANRVAAVFVSNALVQCVAPGGANNEQSDISVSIGGSDGPYSTIPAAFTYFDPSVTQLHPALGPSTPATGVAITGNFEPSGNSILGPYRCRFGSTEVAFSYSATQFICQSPAEAAGSVVDVEFSTSDGLAWTSAGTFTVHDDVTVDSLNPANGDTDGGAPITVTGSGFRTTTGGGDVDAAFCRFGTVTVAAVVNSDTSLDCPSPALAAGDYQISVGYTDDAFSATSATYTVVDLTVATTGLSPTEVTFGVGPSVVLTTATGSVIGTPDCFFGTGSPAAATATTANSVTCTVPSGLAVGSHPVSFTNNGFDFSNTQTLVVRAVPTVTGVSPNNAPHAGGRLLTVSGTYDAASYPASATCSFAGVGTTAGSAIDATTVECPAPNTGSSGAALAAAVSVSLDGSVFSASSAAFTAVDPAGTADISLGPFDQGTVVTFTGTFFAGADAPGCRWVGSYGTIDLAPASVTATTMVCNSPVLAAAATSDVSLTANGLDYSAVQLSFNHYADPTVDSLSPSSAALNQARVITASLTGTVIDSGLVSCAFDGTPAAASNVVVNAGSGSVDCAAPASATDGAAVVTISLNGIHYGASGSTYTYVTPSIVSLSPTSIPINTQPDITINTGAGEVLGDSDGILQCRYGGGSLGVFTATMVSGSSLTCPTPLIATETVSSVQWSNNGLDWSAASSFTFDDLCQTPNPCPASTECRTWTCSGAGVCDFTDNDGILCNSGNGTCAAGTCESACVNDIDCDNGLVCDGDEVCGLGGNCEAGTPLTCALTCTEAAGGCPECLDAADCTQPSDFCVQGELCTAFTCVTDTAPICAVDEVCDEVNDRCVECTSNGDCTGGELCETGAGVCVECLTDANCGDGAFCNGVEICSAGVCTAGFNPCGGSTPYCNEVDDICEECASAGDCDDGLFCNGAEVCTSGSCASGSDPCPGSFCDETNDECDECVFDSDCDDGLYCNGVETCTDGACDVSPGNPCSGPTPFCQESDDSCNECAQDSDCPDDLLFCNGEEVCLAGVCGHANVPTCGAFCDDTLGCVDCLADLDCDDGVFCDGVETCDATGTCQEGPDPCAAGSCNEVDQTCTGVNTPDITAVIPNAGLPAGAETTQVFGTGFVSGAGVIRCDFDASTDVSNPTVGAFVSATEVTCPIPPLGSSADTTTTVRVSQDNGVSYSNTVVFYYNTPVINSITPTAGAPQGGDEVVLDTGSSLLVDGTGVSCYFNGIETTSYINGDNQLVCLTPVDPYDPINQANSTVQVTFSNDGREQSNGVEFFFYALPEAPPVVSNFAPNSVKHRHPTRRWPEVPVTIQGSEIGPVYGEHNFYCRFVYPDPHGSIIVQADSVSSGSMVCVPPKAPRALRRWPSRDSIIPVGLEVSNDGGHEWGAADDDFFLSSPRISSIDNLPRRGRIPLGSEKVNITVAMQRGAIDNPDAVCRWECLDRTNSCASSVHGFAFTNAYVIDEFNVLCETPIIGEWSALDNPPNANKFKVGLRFSNNGIEFGNRKGVKMSDNPFWVYYWTVCVAGGGAAIVGFFRVRQQRRRGRGSGLTSDDVTTVSDDSTNSQSWDEQGGTKGSSSSKPVAAASSSPSKRSSRRKSGSKGSRKSKSKATPDVADVPAIPADPAV